MPDPSPLTKRRPPRGQNIHRPLEAEPASSGYAELHCKTNFSFLEGASHPDELVQQAAQLGYQALAVTDRNSLAGVARAHVAAKDCGLKLLIGAEITVSDALDVVLLATSRSAYGRLSRLLTVGRRRAAKGECLLSFDDLAQHSDGLLACVLPSPPEPLPSEQHSTEEPVENEVQQLHRYHDAFRGRSFLLAELHLGPCDQLRLQQLIGLAQAAEIPLVAANDVHFHEPQRSELQDVLTAIRHGCTVADLGSRRFANAERYLKTRQQLKMLFRECPGALERTVEIAGRCAFSLDELRYEYPDEPCPPGITPLEYLQESTWQGARQRYPQGIPDRVSRLIKHELRLIAELRYEAYFLTVWDIVKFARSRPQEILCQGRGSAANSVVCYCLGITSVDPAEIDVLFERFVSKERDEAPDIDVDFEHERREEVLQYIYQKYGRDRAGIAATVITYRPRSAIRDVGKALGLSLDRVDVLAKNIHRYDQVDRLHQELRNAGLDPASSVAKQLIELTQELLSFPRHLSQHVGGMVITRGPLCELVPIENAAMPDRTVVQWDKDDLESLGILKVDCLSLGMLTAIRKCFDLIKQCYHQQFTLASVPQDDPAVYEMIQKADTIGVFQIESRAQMSMLPRLRPTCYYDLVIEVSIVRPGPIQGKMVHPYLRRRNGEEQPYYPNEKIRAVLGKTHGVPIFQEQAMRLAMVAGGFSPGEADQLRRAMGAWRRRGIIDQFEQKLIDGMQANGYSTEFAKQLYQQIQGFGDYGFPESHAASFAKLAYVSAWMKCHFPAAFTAALLNSQPMGFYAPAQLVTDARNHGVNVLPIDVNCSDWDCTLEAEPADGPEPPVMGNRCALRLGFRLVSGLSPDCVARIIAERDPQFVSLEEFRRRTKLSSALMRRLSKADVFRSLDTDRRSALWDSLPAHESRPLLDDVSSDEPFVELPEMAACDEVVADYQSTGLSLKGHPFQFLRSMLEQRNVMPAERLPHVAADRRYTVAGLVLLRQRPSTANNVTFVTLEDETGTVNLIVRESVWKKYRRVAHAAQALLVVGRLQRERETIHILVDQIEDLTAELADVKSRSRDFH